MPEALLLGQERFRVSEGRLPQDNLMVDDAAYIVLAEPAMLPW